MNLLTPNPIYKPFRYPWAYEAWKTQQQIHWMPEEVPLDMDVMDWKTKLSPEERNLLTQIFRFFTQADIEVNDCYMQHYSRVFQPTEVKMMLAAFSNMETIHIAAYSHLLDTIGMPEVEYSAFLQHEEMRRKHDYMRRFSSNNHFDLAITMAAFGAFTEGMQLFATFAILMNFPRHNKMKGMGQVITWSVRDESLHCTSVIKLWHTFIKETGINHHDLAQPLLDVCNDIVALEDNFIDLAFEQGPVQGLTAADVKAYVRYIADRRLNQLGYNSEFGIRINPLPWMDEILNGVEHTNFFENRATEYTKAATTGTWDEAFEGMAAA